MPRPRHSTLRERPGTHFIGGWVGPRAGLNRCGKVRPHRDSLSGASRIYRIAIPTTLSGPSLRNYRKIFLKSEELILGWLIFGSPRTILIMTILQWLRMPRLYSLLYYPLPRPISNTLSTCFSYNMRDQVSLPFKTTGQDNIQKILILIILDGKL